MPPPLLKVLPPVVLGPGNFAQKRAPVLGRGWVVWFWLGSGRGLLVGLKKGLGESGWGFGPSVFIFAAHFVHFASLGWFDGVSGCGAYDWGGWCEVSP
jgi:hypothetical protein